MDRVSYITTERRREVTEPSRPLPWISYEPRIVWRAWRIVPDERALGRPPMLAGLFGFPWRTAELDAKCTLRDRAGGGSPMQRQWVDRHHQIVPDAECSCGIYATEDELTQTPMDVAPRGQPLATGFVRLSGRTLIAPGAIRAQHAQIIGPLSVLSGLPPVGVALGQRLGIRSRPRRVITERNHYRVAWTATPAGEPLEAWRATTAERLADRYGVAVVGIDGPPAREQDAG